MFFKRTPRVKRGNVGVNGRAADAPSADWEGLGENDTFRINKNNKGSFHVSRIKSVCRGGGRRAVQVL